jgi:hypothetical protein
MVEAGIIGPMRKQISSSRIFYRDEMTMTMKIVVGAGTM